MMSGKDGPRHRDEHDVTMSMHVTLRMVLRWSVYKMDMTTVGGHAICHFGFGRFDQEKIPEDVLGKVTSIFHLPALLNIFPSIVLAV